MTYENDPSAVLEHALGRGDTRKRSIGRAEGMSWVCGGDEESLVNED